MNLYKKNPRFFKIRSYDKDSHEKSNGKKPAINKWQEIHFDWRHAQREIDRGFNIGFALPEHLLVLDVDPRNGGTESYNRLLLDTGLPDMSTIYPTVKTGGGGYHYYMTLRPQDMFCTFGSSKNYPGIDIKAFGGYVLTAGSYTKEEYVCIHDPKRCAYMYPKLADIFRHVVSKVPRIESNNETITNEQLAQYLSCLDARNYGNNDTWFPIMCAAFNATNGAGLQEFIEWSTTDPRYAHSENEIIYRWNSLKDVDNKITIATILAEIPPSVRKSSDFGDVSLFNNAENKSYVDNITGELVKVYDSIDDIPYLMALAVTKKYKIVYGADERYWIYNNKYWKPYNNMYVKGLILKTFTESGVSKSATAIVGSTENILGPMVSVDYVPGQVCRDDHSVINVENGELWLDDKTGKHKLYDHNPDSSLTFCLPIKYNKRAMCNRFERALDEMFNDIKQSERVEVIRHLWELIGYTIQGKKNIATWVLLYGRGANGKSVILDVLTALLGKAAKPIQIADLAKDGHSFAMLPGALAVIDDDMQEGIKLPSSQIKKLSENKSLTANPKFATPFDFVQTAIPWMACNSLPKTFDLSDGMRRRAQIFRFCRVFEKGSRDEYLKEYLINNELPGILNKALEGLRRLRARGYFAEPDSVKNAVADWYGKSDSSFVFKSDCLEQSEPGTCRPFGEIWDAYQAYANEAGLRREMLPKHRLIEVLNNAGVPIAKNNRGIYVIYNWRLRKKVKRPQKSQAKVNP